ncbi:hypothetical protein GOP47_0021353 [Adiantum capillus-veneris]|uniref:Insulin-degrading enzyme-like 1, peroxisomal n=1 Tax=Adiantum capillus-veneris TaxID=13818 RepID=A0A9D4U9F6_ADICA|nr:hypothetical protein GOP47_0021353 [Adiantum capillus-veneris]
MGDVEVPILKPRNDPRLYRHLVLPNGLQALLISDPETDKAAASMNVCTGYFSDPDGLEGLAHFLEHMLFFSSAKYPLEDSYMKYLTEHGGHSNAFTSSEKTNFHFDANADHLEEALDRFAQFFICPLMSEDATSREMKAVDSENTKNLTSDSWRSDQLLKHSSSRSHPYSKFGTGNIETLDLYPKEKGVDTHKELLKFYDSHYSSNLMCLAVYGRESLDNLQTLVESRFGAIKNTQKERPAFPGQPCGVENLQIMIKAIPIKELHSLLLSWPIAPELLRYKEAPCQYISHLLGHEAEGSLFALLKSLGWTTSLGAGESDSSLEYAFFTVRMELTDLGQDHVEDIIGLAFQYIRILEETRPQEWIFRELQAVREMNFHFKDKRAPLDYVVRLACSMMDYPAEDWIAGSSLPCIFNADSIMTTIKMLTPENVRILSTSKSYEGKTTDVEPWYKTLFSVERVSDIVAKEWRNSSIDARLYLPTPNPFIPTNFSLKPNSAMMEYPSLLRKTSRSRLWFKPDVTFKTPKAYIEIHFESPESNNSPEASVLSTLFVNLLLDYLNEQAYYAEVAGLSYRVFRTIQGFQVSVSGYNHKITSLLDTIIDRIIKFQVIEDRFLVVKERVLKTLLNFRFWQPYQQALYYCSLILHNKKWGNDAYLEAITPLEPADLASFFPRLMSRVSFECYVAGNMDAAEAESLAVMIEKSLANGPMFKSKPIFGSQHAERRIMKLEPQSKAYYPVAGSNLSDANSALTLYLQVCQDDELLNALLELFLLSTKQEAFYQLRTVQQLGYIVVLANRDDSGVRGAQFIIQSALKDPKDLDARVEEFLSLVHTNLSQLTDEEFKSNVHALVGIKLEKHKNLAEETGFFWNEIDCGTQKFSRQKDEVGALRKVCKQDLLDFYTKYIKANAPERAKLSICVYGGAHQDEFKSVVEEDKNDNICEPQKVHKKDEEEGKASFCIKDIFDFKRSQLLYGSLR